MIVQYIYKKKRGLREKKMMEKKCLKKIIQPKNIDIQNL